MPIVRDVDTFLKDRFLFSGNNIILENNELPSIQVLKRCIPLSVASVWFSDKEYDFTAVELEKNCPVPAGCQSMPLRSFFWEKKQNPEITSKAARARCLLNFRSEFRYCSCCGGALKDDDVLTARVCVQCGRPVFPKLEPAVIVLVQKENKILLARHKNRNDNVFSCIAGFVEAGEKIEETVSREVMEETGIKVCNVRYVGSQAWPYPDQLMLAFVCDWQEGEIVIQEDELVEAAWFDRTNLPKIPSPGSVAYNLIAGLF